MPLLLRAVFQLLKNWRAILASTGLVLATGFSFGRFVKEAGDSAHKFWWIAALACVVVLAREYMKGYFDLKKEELYQKDRK